MYLLDENSLKETIKKKNLKIELLMKDLDEKTEENLQLRGREIVLDAIQKATEVYIFMSK